MLAGLGAVGRIGRHGVGGGSGAASASKRPNYSIDLTRGQLGQGMTLARASVGTYYDSAGVLRTAGVNVPRFDYDPVTHASRGLLLEDASTNLFWDSTTGGTTWAVGGVALAGPVKTANNIIAPDGTTTGTQLVYPAVSAAGSASNIQQSPTMTAVPYTFSVWLRGNVGGETTYICTTPDGVTYFRQQCVLTTTWQRFVLTTGNLTAASWFWIIGTDRRDTQQAATPAQTIYTWGSQLEQSDHATSYIATAAATATRAIDNCLLAPNSSWFDGFVNGKGTWFAEFDYLDATPINGARVLGTGGNPNSSTPIQILSGRNISQYDGGPSMNSPTITTVNEVARAITTWQPGQAKVCANGGVVATSALLPNGYATNLGFLGVSLMSVGGGQSCEGHMRVLKYWKRILSDTEMQTNTALDGPSLSLDFMSPGVLDSRITFTRASTGTYFDITGVMRTAAANAPRWDYDPSTLALKGLLIEDARTNLIFPSADFTVWIPSNVTTTLNAGAAPDGTNTMTKMVDQAINSFHCIVRGFAITASQQYTFSIYLKMGEIRYFNVWFDSGALGVGAVFDLQNGVISGAISAVGGATAGQALMQPIGNGIYRCSVSGILGAGTSLRASLIHFATPNGTGFPPYLGVAGQGTFMWGAQVEAGTFPTSHIPTTIGAVTRAVEACTIPPANISPWFASPGGSWFAEFDHFDNAPPNARVIDRINGIGGPGALTLSAARLIGQYDGGSGVVVTSPATTINTIAKAASTWAPGIARVCANGGAIASSTTMVIGYGIYTATGVGFMGGGFAGSSDNLSGHIRKVQYWPRTLNDAEMQTKTLADVSAPSLVLDFMQPGVLDPRLVMSRPSVATYFDVSGTMQTATNNQPRWDYDPNNGTFRGVLIENTRTNGMSNSTMQGVIAGTPGTPPTNWGYNFGATGLSTQVVGRGTDKGIPYVDIRFFGTVAATGGFNVYLDTSTSIPAITGQSWCLTFYWKMTAGNMTGLSAPQINLREVDAGGAIMSDHFVLISSPGTGVLAMQRVLYVNLLLNGGANTAFIRPMITFQATAAAAVNMTLRIAAPQVELGPFESSFIPTSGSAVTRAADDMYMPLGPWFSPTNTSLFSEYIYPRVADAQFAHNPVAIGDGQSGANNKFVLRALGVNLNTRSMFSKRAGVVAAVPAIGAPVQTVTKLAASWDASIGMVTAVGLTPGVGGSQIPLNLIQLVVGDQDRGVGESLDGCIRKIMYWNKTLPAIELQSVTT